jgi:hypothetical protein
LQFAPSHGGTGFLRLLLAGLGLAFPAAWLLVRRAAEPPQPDTAAVGA